MSIEHDIESLLNKSFKPEHMILVNESYKHKGHAGVGDANNSHFKLTIVSKEFENKTRIVRHQMVYKCLGELMNNPIHALTIHAYAPNEKE